MHTVTSIECAAKRDRTKTPAEATTREGPSLVIRVPLTTGALPAPYQHTFCGATDIKRGQAKSGECQPKLKTEQNMRGLKPKSKSQRDCQRVVNQMNRICILQTSYSMFSTSKSYACAMRKLRLAPNQALHVTSIYNNILL